MYDLDLITTLTKKATKAKARSLPSIAFQKSKSEGWIVLVNGNRTASYGRYASAELAALIQGAAIWQLEAARVDSGEPVETHRYPHFSDLQKLDYSGYLNYLNQYA